MKRLINLWRKGDSGEIFISYVIELYKLCNLLGVYNYNIGLYCIFLLLNSYVFLLNESIMLSSKDNIREKITG